MGDWGRRPNHIDEALKNYIGTPRSPGPNQYSVPIIVTKERAGTPAIVQPIQFPIMEPHILFSSYFNEDPSKFSKMYLGEFDTEEKRGHVWMELVQSGDPRILGHPVL